MHLHRFIFLIGPIFSFAAFAQLYPNNLKNRDFNKAGVPDLQQQSVTEIGHVQDTWPMEAAAKMEMPAKLKTDSSSCLGVTQEEISKRVYAHLLIHDPASASIEAKKGIEAFPESKILRKAYIRALCEEGKEIEAFEEWTAFTSRYEEEQKDHATIEALAWGVLHKADMSSQLPIAATSLLGATFTNDVKALPILFSHLRSSNALLRSLAVRQAASFGDAPLKEEIIRLLKEEKVWFVRQEVIRAVGQLRLKELSKELKEIIGNPKTQVEEKAAAIIALVNMYEMVDKEELNSLVKSDRAGLRRLACELITHFNLYQYLDEIVRLLKDSNSDVRTSALTTLGLLRVEKWNKQPLFPIIAPLLQDPSPEVSITAGWLAMLLGEKEGERLLIECLESSLSERRRLAAAALIKTGKKGIPCTYQAIKETQDPYVRLNLSLGLITQRQHVEFACDMIYSIFHDEKDTLWMWNERSHPLFDFLEPSDLRHVDHIPHYPKIVDQQVRLSVLSALSIVRYPKAKQTLREFLKNQIGKMPNFAAATLLEEGDEEEVSLVKDLLNDSDERIRLQAAFILALRGRDISALNVLKAAYPQADREMKIHILEAIAQVGGHDSIPFLLEIFKEPFQVMRIVAASALIQCLYH